MTEDQVKEGVFVNYCLFESMEAGDPMPMDERGRLFTAIMEYMRDGKEPDFSDIPMLDTFWPTIKATLDMDREAFVNRNKYNAYYIEALRHNARPLQFVWWEDAGCPTYEEAHDPETGEMILFVE